MAAMVVAVAVVVVVGCVAASSLLSLDNTVVVVGVAVMAVRIKHMLVK